ncbi:serine protease [Pseudonocardiaceae bacterium YIM PH 21723]|nr:serine protease [Pseudonocardiaceae bacterium YIM PH 21723]
MKSGSAILLAVALALVTPGVANATGTIVGGHAATQTYSFMVSLQNSNGHFCGASLIRPNWVVTARHCVQSTRATSVQARVGSTSVNQAGTVTAGSRIITHEKADIALMQLAQPVSEQPIPIATSSGRSGTPTRLLGWGQTCPARACGQPPTTLQELDTRLVADSGCEDIDGRTEICTDNPDGRSGACYGDSGGPQVTRVSGRWELIGATSRAGNSSENCATGPSIYTDVPALNGWIKAQIG